MATIIKIKRGLKTNLPALSIGELGYCTDTKELFIGTDDGLGGTENVLISDIDDFYTKAQVEDLDGTGLVWNSGTTKFDLDFANGTQALDDTNESKAMNPKRTAEMIDNRVNTTLTSANYATETYVNNGLASIGGTGLTWDANDGVYDIDNPFNPSGNYENLRAQSTTATDVGLGNVTNESKATMFANPEFTGNVKVPTPTAGTDAANKAYVDEIAEGLKTLPAAHAATTANITATYDNGTSGVGATLTIAATATLDIDGVTNWTLGDNLLVKDQTNAFENGSYVLTTVGDAGTAWVFTRCDFCDEPDEIPGAYEFVIDGTNNGGTGWVGTVNDPATFTIGTDAITYVQFSGAGTYTAGTGLNLTGTEFSIDTAEVVDLGSAQTITGAKTFTETISGNIDGSAASLIEVHNNIATSIWVGNETDYGQLTPDSNTLYFIEE